MAHRVDLTAEELTILKCVASGLQDKQIAPLVHRSEASVKDHVAQIKRKLNAFNRPQMVDNAYKRGDLKVDDNGT